MTEKEAFSWVENYALYTPQKAKEMIESLKSLKFDSSVNNENIKTSEHSEHTEPIENVEKGHNNGGSTDYYKFNENWKEVMDIIEDRNLNFSQGNILKAAFCFNVGRHSGTDYERELNKIIYFCERELKRIKDCEDC